MATELSSADERASHVMILSPLGTILSSNGISALENIPLKNVTLD